MTNLTGKSRQKWRDAGYTVEGAETVTSYGGKVLRHDLFGFADLIAYRPGEIILLQVTSWSNISARANKIARQKHGKGQYCKPMIDIAKDLLSVAGVRIVVEGWHKEDRRWRSRELEITAAELDKRTDG